ncbi:hypothetical protein CVT26_004627 [Gymnopilus dilepis]|uniref:Ubiquitin-like protease family profile domain-containing protein n=1 Tax=Gymnopilus dilepis TaxID=231916 RepID=A0A409YTM8_9AGAR|nr:hypothetical protein CVT26_004627 [Gymnopilus dilepis]
MSPAIPPEIQTQILPSQDLSILELLKFPLPIIQKSLRHQLQPQDFFSTLKPTTFEIDTIRAAPVLPLSLLKQLEASIDLQQVSSILCPHAPSLVGAQLPTWVLAFWIEAARIWPVKSEWILAEEKLDARKKNGKRTGQTIGLVTCVFDALASLSWADKVKGFPGLVDIDILATYTTNNWLKDEHENQMLQLLECELTRTRNDEGVRIADTFLITKLMEIYGRPDHNDHYLSAPNLAWLRNLGQELGNGVLDKLATIINIGQNHWVAVIVDFQCAEILHGDSLSGTIPAELEATLTWWTFHHTAQHFPIKKLPITQQRDGYSCGLLAWNALATRLLPDQHSLMDSMMVADERLKVLLQVIDRHHEKDYQFTFTKPLREKMPEYSTSATVTEDGIEHTSFANLPPVFIPPSRQLTPSSNSNVMHSHTATPTPTLPPGLTIPPLGPSTLPSQLVTPPPRQVAGTKRSAVDQTPERSLKSKPVQKIFKSAVQKVKSSIRNALELSKEAEDLGDNPKFGLLRYWSKGTAADKQAYFDREDERAENDRSEKDVAEKTVATDKKLHERDLAKRRQQKRRSLMKKREIKEGVHSPGSTKRKVR